MTDVEKEVRHSEPNFLGGFETVALQGQVMRLTVSALEHLRARLTGKSFTLTQELRILRSQYSHHASGDPSVDDSFGAGNSPRAGPQSCSSSAPVALLFQDPVSRNKLSPAQRATPAHRAKVQFQNIEHTYRNRIAGLELVVEMVDDCSARLQLRLKGIRTLMRIGRKWHGGQLTQEDAIKVGMAEREIMDGEGERVEISAMMSVLERWLDAQDRKVASTGNKEMAGLFVH